jgi:hypothetical protein
MKKYLLPSLLILACFAASAIGQNINRAVQLSQDPTGLFGVDSSNNVYFPAHVLTTTRGGPPPTVTGATCGTTAPSVTGTDFAGLITVGTSATTSCVLTFGTAFVTAPVCLLTPKSAILAALSYATSTTALTITQTSTASNTIAYLCTSAS